MNIKMIAVLLTVALAPIAGAADAPPASAAGVNAPAQAQAADAASGTAAASAAPAPEASIPFANHGGIYNWRVVNDRTVLIQSQSRRWYKATLLSSCSSPSGSDLNRTRTAASTSSA